MGDGDGLSGRGALPARAREGLDRWAVVTSAADGLQHAVLQAPGNFNDGTVGTISEPRVCVCRRGAASLLQPL